jgi:ELWxxDGT repeat protein
MTAKGLRGFGMTSACLLAGLGMAVSASGQTAYLVEDLTPGIIGGEASYPSGLVAAGNRVFFGTSPHFPGNNELGEAGGLWTSDGTAAGTRQLPDGCLPDCFGPSSRFVGVAGSLSFFITQTSEGLPQLWRSDGTVAGTFVLIELSLHPEDVSFTVLNNILYFLRFSTSEQLWRSDGTVAGTTLVADVGPTFVDFGLVAAAGKLFF